MNKQGSHYWQTGKADKATVLIDYANYYRELYYAICRARHSIFILGWDIDSRIQLLRGKEAEGKNKPIRLFDLIVHKAKENPQLKVYLNRWDYSFFMVKEREPFSSWKWRLLTPPNVQYCNDNKLPFTACHHQKLVVIDDQIAFCGGMDITQGRWDQRQHHVEAEERVDPGGLFNPFSMHCYDSYHDIQVMCIGPVVKWFGELARERWAKGAGTLPIPIHVPDCYDGEYWFKSISADFEESELGIARTMPRTAESETIQEILHTYLYEIAQAEKIIYIENQYLSNLDIAKALNKQLKAKPALRVLIITCKHPQGFLENKSMWAGRVEFCDILGKQVDIARYAVMYPVCQENGVEMTIRIHSKLMIVDDKFLHIGSANLNNRSMGFDTECDTIIEGKDDKSRQRISAIRNNLIREHTGLEESVIQDTIENSCLLTGLIEYQAYSRQHIKPIDNIPYRNQRFVSLVKKVGDPKEANAFTVLPIRDIFFWLVVISLVLTAIGSVFKPYLSDWLSYEKITGLIREARHSSWALFWVIGIYIVAGVIFFPVNLLNITTAIVFGSLKGVLLALAGSVTSASIGFIMGRMIGGKALHLSKPVAEKIRKYTNKGDIFGMTVVRLMPIAPYTVVNITFGILNVSYVNYILATIFGLIPGIAAKGLFGGSLEELWTHPNPRVITTLVFSIVLWIGVIWMAQRIVRHYQREYKS